MRVEKFHFHLSHVNLCASFVFTNPSWVKRRNFVVVQGVFRSFKICSSRAPGGQGMHGIILVHIIKTFQKVPDNFAFIKNRVITEPNVCPSVCLCDCPSGCLPLRKSAITFDPLEGSARNFQGSLTSSQVIFGRVTWTPGPSGSGPDPEKGGFCRIFLLRGF